MRPACGLHQSPLQSLMLSAHITCTEFLSDSFCMPLLLLIPQAATGHGGIIIQGLFIRQILIISHLLQWALSLQLHATSSGPCMHDQLHGMPTSSHLCVLSWSQSPHQTQWWSHQGLGAGAARCVFLAMLWGPRSGPLRAHRHWCH